MNVLYALPYTPIPAQYGATLRMFNLIRQTLRYHDVSIAYMGFDGTETAIADAFEGKLRTIRRAPRPWARSRRRASQVLSLFGGHSHMHRMGRSAAFEALLREELDSGRYDIVQTEFPHIVPNIPETGAVRILDAHNVEYDLIRRQYEQASNPLRRLHYRDEYRKLRAEEIAAWRSQDLILATSDRDARIIREGAPAVPCTVIPNGVDSRYFAPDPGRCEPDTLVFTGIMKYLPNSDGMGWFLDEILPLVRAEVPGIRLFVVGAEPPAALTARTPEGVTFTGRVPDVRPWVDRAAVSIVPLRMGGGTRLKICEAFAMRKPVVSTSIGAEGIEAVDGESIMIADEPRRFAATIVRLLRDAALRDRLTAGAYELMTELYEWSVIGVSLDRVYRDAAARRAAAGATERASANAVQNGTEVRP